MTVLTTARICSKHLKYDSSTWQFWIRVGKQPWCVSLFIRFEYYEDPRGEKIDNNFVIQFPKFMTS